MLATILEKSFEYNNEVSSIYELFQDVENMLQDSEYVIDFIQVDGINIYQDFEEYLIAHLSEVKDIQFKLILKKDLLKDVIVSAEDYLIRVLQQLRSLSDEFYHSPTNETWERFGQLLEGMQWLHSAINYIVLNNGQDKENEQRNQLTINIMSIEKELNQLEDAVKNGDYTLIGDILNYEILPLLDSTKAILTYILDNEVVRNDLN